MRIDLLRRNSYCISALLLLSLSACGASPAPEFMNAEKVETTRDGHKFAVYHTENRVQVVRLGYATSGEHANIRASMIILASEVTGCQLDETSVQGDSGVMRGSIICPN